MPPQVEKDYVESRSPAPFLRCAETPITKKLTRNYTDAMKSLSQKYPDDLEDAATLYADSLDGPQPLEALEASKARPTTTPRKSSRVLESVLARDPNHVGANHFYIHAVEASLRPERALPSARRLDTMVPQAGHLVHMPSHIYARTGFYN